jgi:hypothetical protein
MGKQIKHWMLTNKYDIQLAVQGKWIHKLDNQLEMVDLPRINGDSIYQWI